MRTRLLCTLGVLAVAALAATAVPAFTADDLGLSLTVTVAVPPPPPAPCVTFATPPGTQVNFGTRAFSKPGFNSFGTGDVAPRFSNCGTATESLFVAGTDAQTVCSAPCAVHTWTLIGGSGSSCPVLINKYILAYGIDGGGPIASVTKATAPLIKPGGFPATYTPGEAHDLSFVMEMPCEGSDGVGESFGQSVTLTATVT
jgi:hypothetical protein